MVCLAVHKFRQLVSQYKVSAVSPAVHKFQQSVAENSSRSRCGGPVCAGQCQQMQSGISDTAIGETFLGIVRTQLSVLMQPNIGKYRSFADFIGNFFQQTREARTSHPQQQNLPQPLPHIDGKRQRDPHAATVKTVHQLTEKTGACQPPQAIDKLKGPILLTEKMRDPPYGQTDKDKLHDSPKLHPFLALIYTTMW